MDMLQLISKYKVWIDTCTWMNHRAETFLTQILPNALLATKQHTWVSFAVTKEVKKAQEHSDPEIRDIAEQAHRWIWSLGKQGVLQIAGYDSSHGQSKRKFYEQLFLNSLEPLALITQNRLLARELCRLIQATTRFKITHRLLTIDRQGQLIPWTQALLTGNRLPIGTQVIKETNIPIPVRTLPRLNEVVYSVKYGALRLTTLLGKGGEGSTYLTQNKKVCKVYTHECLTETRYQKIRLMLEHPIRMPGVCWPKDIVTNHYGEFVGFVMPQAQGKHMQSAIFVRTMLQKNFPHWKREHLVKLAITILQKIKYLHDRNILIGDIQPRNILIENESKIFFVDTDSYQISNYPCPVGTINFTAPEIQGKNFTTFLRTWKHEYFAIATLLFMILIPGRSPYEQTSGKPLDSLIKEFLFPYRVDPSIMDDSPDHLWNKMWSHLPRQIRQAFVSVFQENQRLSPTQWLSLLHQYKQQIIHGETSNEISPTHFCLKEDELELQETGKRSSWLSLF